jgi:cytochrome c-type biogenesis protein CcmH
MARLFLLLVLGCAPVLAQNTELDKRVAALAHELRCLVCQNQPLAVDLRNQIREQLSAGASEREVMDFMVARYGDFVLYRPPFKATTLALWIGPFVFLLAGAWFLRRFLRRRAPPQELSEADRARAAKLLE